MKYDEIVNFFRQGPPGCPGRILEKYKIHIADGHVDFVHGRPEYKATESNEFRFVQTWFWRDWTLDIDDPLQCNHEHARNTARGPYLLLSHLPANLGDKRTVVLFSPSAGKFMPHSKSTFDNSAPGSNQKLSIKQREVFLDRLSKEKVKVGRDHKYTHPDNDNPLSHVVLSEVDLFADQN
ncbi:hypothetical protein YA0089_19070 [Pseudomonas viridiflava]|uniref:hypothetical protein n=1 Tax=Pseudomonas viridiflava TaxID=33069 RepID=UPI0018E60B48|nr:hypothetical protein [Pseudomonas viridiflava]MBI6725710.1 hypothetical protein [Pseudomonas viridiflava]